MRQHAREAAVGLFRLWHALTWRVAAKLSLWWQTGRARALFDDVGRDVRCYGRVHRMGSGRVRLGQSGNLYDGVLLETQGSGTIDIGDDFVLNRGVVISAHSGVHLGNGVMVGEQTSIRDHDHAHGSGAPLREQGYVSAPIVVEDDVWIGRGCAVLKGVRIGRGAVVAANAVVTRDVPAGAVVAGVPARPVPRSAAAGASARAGAAPRDGAGAGAGAGGGEAAPTRRDDP